MRAFGQQLVVLFVQQLVGQFQSFVQHVVALFRYSFLYQFAAIGQQAVAQFDGGAPVKGDILLDGDITHWKKFANSLRMIMALRLSSVDATKGKTEFVDAMNSNGGYLTTNADDVMLAYPGGNYSSVFILIITLLFVQIMRSVKPLPIL